MEKWDERVRKELTELTAKLGALRVFIASPEFLSLTSRTRGLLTSQSYAMATYADALAERLIFD